METLQGWQSEIDCTKIAQGEGRLNRHRLDLPFYQQPTADGPISATKRSLETASVSTKSKHRCGLRSRTVDRLVVKRLVRVFNDVRINDRVRLQSERAESKPPRSGGRQAGGSQYLLVRNLAVRTIVIRASTIVRATNPQSSSSCG